MNPFQSIEIGMCRKSQIPDVDGILQKLRGIPHRFYGNVDCFVVNEKRLTIQSNACG